jgi:hypothetical protein
MGWGIPRIQMAGSVTYAQAVYFQQQANGTQIAIS